MHSFHAEAKGTAQSALAGACIPESGCWLQQDPAVGAVIVLKWGGILNEALHGADPTK